MYTNQAGIFFWRLIVGGGGGECGTYFFGKIIQCGGVVLIKKMLSNPLSNLRAENWILLSNSRAHPENGVAYKKKRVHSTRLLFLLTLFL